MVRAHDGLFGLDEDHVVQVPVSVVHAVAHIFVCLGNCDGGIELIGVLAEVHLLAANRCVGVKRRTTLLDDVLVLGVRVEDRALVGDLGLELEGELSGR